MQASINCFKLIEELEGLRLTAYQDQGGVWTIGYGTIRYPDGRAVKRGDTCTAVEAHTWFTAELNHFSAEVNTYIKMKINQNQFDALVSFAYNLGLGTLKNSSLLRHVNLGQFALAEDCFVEYDHCDGKVDAGLLRRRRAEAALFGKPVA